MQATKYLLRDERTQSHPWYIFYIGKAHLISIEAALRELEHPWHLWIPAYKLHRVKKSDVITVHKRAFPGYVFVNFLDLPPAEYEERQGWLTGVEVQLKNCDPQFKLLRAPCGGVAELLSQELDLMAEVIDAVGEQDELQTEYRVGDYVKIISEPFNDMVGQVAEIKKSKVILKIFFLSKQVNMEVPPDHLQYLVDTP